jgi:hypothetical protein
MAIHVWKADAVDIPRQDVNTHPQPGVLHKRWQLANLATTVVHWIVTTE